MNQAASLCLCGASSVSDALMLPTSVVARFFDGKAFEHWKKSREADAKTQVAIVNRLNDVIRSIGVLAKITAEKTTWS